jgi:hypothetical protein
LVCRRPAVRIAQHIVRPGLCICSIIEVDGARETMIGEARCIANEAEPAVGEFAVSVTGGSQGLGLGRMLPMRLILHCGVRHLAIVADTLACNADMTALASQCGFAARTKREDGRLLHLVEDLQAPMCAFPPASCNVYVVEGMPWQR